MKCLKLYRTAAVLALLVSASCGLFASDLNVSRPPLDANGRFWVYRNGNGRLPFVPYGWMSDDSPNSAMRLEMNYLVDSSAETKGSGPGKGQKCMRITVNWATASWAAIAFISGRDDPPWWGETNAGGHFDLRGLKKKKLIFFARGDQGGECIKVQIGILGDHKYGDSLTKPLSSDLLKLNTQWQRYELDLAGVPSDQLSRVCNGFGVLAEYENQTGSPANTRFYLADVYFE